VAVYKIPSGMAAMGGMGGRAEGHECTLGNQGGVISLLVLGFDVRDAFGLWIPEATEL